MNSYRTIVSLSLLATMAGCSAPLDSDEVDPSSSDEIRAGEVFSFAGRVTREEITVGAGGNRTFSAPSDVGAGSVSVGFRQTERSCGEGSIAATVVAKFPSLSGGATERKVFAITLRNETVTFNSTRWVGTVQEAGTTYQLAFQNSLSEICQSHALKKDTFRNASFGMWNANATQNLEMK